VIYTPLAECRRALTHQDDQINCLIILIIFMKQRTYLITLPNRFTPGDGGTRNLGRKNRLAH
jgi:hypothetical protein